MRWIAVIGFLLLSMITPAQAEPIQPTELSPIPVDPICVKTVCICLGEECLTDPFDRDPCVLSVGNCTGGYCTLNLAGVCWGNCAFNVASYCEGQCWIAIATTCMDNCSTVDVLNQCVDDLVGPIDSAQETEKGQASNVFCADYCECTLSVGNCTGGWCTLNLAGYCTGRCVVSVASYCQWNCWIAIATACMDDCSTIDVVNQCVDEVLGQIDSRQADLSEPAASDQSKAGSVAANSTATPPPNQEA